MKEFSRPEKLNDAETIVYEIQMVRFAASRVRQRPDFNPDGYAFLECFLLHYRNLIEFFGNEEKHIRNTDLHVSNIWEKSGLPEPSRLFDIRERGNELWKAYERVEDSISRYLHHCTTYRTGSKSWEVGKMMRELEPLLAEVEKALGRHLQSLNSFDANSTATIPDLRRR
jgi:hypothetical protein